MNRTVLLFGFVLACLCFVLGCKSDPEKHYPLAKLEAKSFPRTRLER
jgi:hypothetical protein